MSNQMNNETKTAIEHLFEVYMDKKFKITLEAFKEAWEIEAKQFGNSFKVDILHEKNDND
jgi:hypothetical protein